MATGIDFTLCCRIHPPEHFRQKCEVDEVHFVDEVRVQAVAAKRFYFGVQDPFRR